MNRLTSFGQRSLWALIALVVFLIFAEIARLSTQCEEVDYHYEIVVTGTSNGCPCSYEVWQVEVTNTHNGDDDWIIHEDTYERILTHNECYKYDNR